MSRKLRNKETLDPDAVTREVQQAFAPDLQHSKSVVQELITERRAEEIKEWPVSEPLGTVRTAVEQAQSLIRQYVPEGVSLVDEFLTERREMWGEED